MENKTLRDEFAIAALQGYLSAPDCNVDYLTIKGSGNFKLGLAIECYEHADAMLKIRQGEINE